MIAKRERIRRQIDQKLADLHKPGLMAVPPRGWIRAIREALGMTGAQLGRRLGVSKQRVQRIEQDEIQGALTLRTMRETARALKCHFVYALVPEQSLAEVVRSQAEAIARDRIRRASQSMRLENQELDQSALQETFEELVTELMSESSTRIWDFHHDD